MPLINGRTTFVLYENTTHMANALLEDILCLKEEKTGGGNVSSGECYGQKRDQEIRNLGRMNSGRRCSTA